MKVVHDDEIDDEGVTAKGRKTDIEPEVELDGHQKTKWATVDEEEEIGDGKMEEESCDVTALDPSRHESTTIDANAIDTLIGPESGNEREGASAWSDVARAGIEDDNTKMHFQKN